LSAVTCRTIWMLPPISVLVQFGAHLQSTGIEFRFRGYALIRDGNVVRWFA